MRLCKEMIQTEENGTGIFRSLTLHYTPTCVSSSPPGQDEMNNCVQLVNWEQIKLID